MEVQYNDAEPEVPLSNWWTNSVYPAENLASGTGGGFGQWPSDFGYEDYWPAPGENWGDMPSVLMFTVSPAAPKLYWIIGTADYYTGSGWAKTTNSSQVESFPPEVESAAYVFNVEFNTTSQKISLPIPQHQTNVTSLSLDPLPVIPSLYLDPLANMYGIEVPGLKESMKVTYYATYTPTTVNSSLINVANVPENIRQWYLQLPDNLPQGVRDLAENLRNPSLSTMDQILADIQYLKSNYIYSETGVEVGGAENQTFTGSVTTGKDSSQHSFTVPANATALTVELTMPSGADFDLSVWNPDNNRTGGWTSSDHSTSTNIPNSSYGGVGASPESVTVTSPSAGTWKVSCYSFSGSGTYTIRVSITSDVSSVSGAPEGDWVQSFLSRGYGTCMDFSAALAIILRLQGIPSRVNFGFKPGPVLGDKVLYLSSDGHSETEAYLPPYGWVRFDATPSAPGSDGEGDTDGDGLPDIWENQYGLNPNLNDASGDADGDGYTNLQEYQGLSDPTDATSHPGNDDDADGMPNTWENFYGLNPNLNDAGQDADGDGYTNLQEYQQGTNPNDATSYPGSDETGNPPITDNQQIPPENQPIWTTTSLNLTISPENATRLEYKTVTFTIHLQTSSASLAYKQITLQDGTTNEDIATLTTNSSGYASTTRTYGTSDPLGEHYITASFAGDSTYTSSSDTGVFLLYSPTTLTLELSSSTVRQGESLSFDGELKDDLGEGVSGKSITLLIDGQTVEGSSVTTGVGGKYQGSIVVGSDLSLGYHQLQAKFESTEPSYLSSQSITRTFQVLEAAGGVTPPENTQVGAENVAAAGAAQGDDTLLYLGVAIAAAIVVALAVFKLMPRGKLAPVVKALKLPSPADLQKLLGNFGMSKKYREGLIAAYKRFAEMLAEAEIYPVKEDQTARELSSDLSFKLKSFARDDFDDFVTTYEKAMFTDRPITKTEYDEAAEKFLNSIKKIKVAEPT